MSSIPNYSVEVQDLYLQMFLSNGDAYARCQNIFDHTHFDKRLANTAKFIKEYVDQYRSMPATETVNANCKTTYSPLNLDDDDYAWLLDTYEQFARHRALENAIVQSTDLLTKGDYNLVEKMIKDAVQISLNRDIGTDYFKSPKERLTALRDRNGIISTGWESVDRPLYGGLGRGTLTIFAAGSGGGKSLFLANLGINWAFQKLNVVYFTFELSEELVAMRLDAMTTGRSTKDIFRNIDDVDLKVKMLAKTSGHIQIKYMPSGKTCNDLRSYLKEYKVKTGVVPDIILVDYLDLMMPLGVKVSPSDMFIKDKYVSEELRNLASETGSVLVSAAQLNRSSVDEIEFDHSHISGGLSKIQTADNVIGIFTNRAMREAGRYQIQYMKTRSSAGVGQSVELKFDQQSLRIRDMDEGSAPTPTISSLASSIKRTVTTTGTNHSSNNGTNTQHNSNAKPGGLASLRDQLARLNPERD